MNSQTEKESGKVYFIGAGPGDADLITVRGKKILNKANVVLYSGSLINEDILSQVSPSAVLHNTVSMKLEKQIKIMREATAEGKCVARLVSGDPSIYGAIDEQIERLNKAGIPFEIIPGVSSAFAAAATLGIEYTQPGVTQTVIFTRMPGKTPVPELERLRYLAQHRTSLAIFLSTGLISSAVEELLEAGYAKTTPVAVVYRASWPDQKVMLGTLETIEQTLEKEEITHQSLIIISPSLQNTPRFRSHLYEGFQEPPSTRHGTAILALTAQSASLAREIHAWKQDSYLYLPKRLTTENERNQPDVIGFDCAVRQVLQDAFQRHTALICIMACGIVVRELAPLLKSKHTDPAVVVMDPFGRFAISVLSGHEGGANHLARELAAFTHGQAVITTASDHQNIPALDLLAQAHGWKLHPNSRLEKVMAALINHEPVALFVDQGIKPPKEIEQFAWVAVFRDWDEAVSSGIPHIVGLTYHQPPQEIWLAAPNSAIYFLPCLVIGIGCHQGTASTTFQKAIDATLQEFHLAHESVTCLATVKTRQNEPGLLEIVASRNWKLRTFPPERIRQVANLPNPSAKVRHYLGIGGVAEPAALLAAGGSCLIVEKQKFQEVTTAVAVTQNHGDGDE